VVSTNTVRFFKTALLYTCIFFCLFLVLHSLQSYNSVQCVQCTIVHATICSTKKTAPTLCQWRCCCQE